MSEHETGEAGHDIVNQEHLWRVAEVQVKGRGKYDSYIHPFNGETTV